MPAERVRAVVDLVLAAGLLAFAAVTIVVVIPAEILEPRTRFGTAQGAVSPSALPYIVCSLIGFGAFLYLLRTVAQLSNGGAGGPAADRSIAVSWRLPAIVALAAAYIATFDRLSFAYSTPVFLVAAYVTLRERPFRTSLLELAAVAAGGGAFTLLVKAIFERGLKVYLGG